jgi:hypothetical protein
MLSGFGPASASPSFASTAIVTGTPSGVAAASFEATGAIFAGFGNGGMTGVNGAAESIAAGTISRA